MKQTRGSAILIAIFLVAAVGSVAFGIGRLFMLDSSIANMFENSTVAYYAAESGIEEGLLRYRYEANQEVGANPANTRIFNIDGGAGGVGNSSMNNSATFLYNPAQRYYTLSDTYLTRWYGEDVAAPTGTFDGLDINDTSYPAVYTIPKDEAIKLDISKIVNGADDIDLLVKFVDPISGGSCSYPLPTFMEVKLTGPAPTSNKYQTKIALVNSSDTNNFDESNIIKVSPGTGDVLKFIKLIDTTRTKNNAPIFDNDDNAELFLKPIGCSAKIGIKKNVDSIADKKLPSPYNAVKATGYYGGITRTIEAKIDRQAGTVYDLFDYVVYQQ